MKTFIYLIPYQSDNKKTLAINDLLFSGYISFMYKNFAHSYNSNMISSSILQKLYSIKISYKRDLYGPDSSKNFNDFQLKVLRNLLNILENNLDKNPISKYIKYNIDEILYYYDQLGQNSYFQIVDFIKSFCNIYNLNNFNGTIKLPRFIFDENMILIQKFCIYPNISVDLDETSNSTSLDLIVQNHFANFILSILDSRKTLDEIIAVGDNLFLEYSHESNFNRFFITEICRKIYNSNYDYSILTSRNDLVINSFIFKQKLIDILFHNKHTQLSITHICNLLNIKFNEYQVLKNKLSLYDKEIPINYFMNKERKYNHALEATDDKPAEDEPAEDEPIEDEPVDDEPTDDSTLDEPSSDDPIKDEKSQANKKLKFKFELASKDETLEDLLYKLHVYKVLTEYLKKEEGVKLSFTKKIILKNWLTKWIFLLAVTETKSLIKEFKIKV